MNKYQIGEFVKLKDYKEVIGKVTGYHPNDDIHGWKWYEITTMGYPRCTKYISVEEQDLEPCDEDETVLAALAML